MTMWTVKVPGAEHSLSTEELKIWAEGGKIKGDTIVIDQNGEHWTAKQIPGLFSTRDWLVTLLLSIFVGTLGIDRFYLGKIGTGFLKLITVGGFGIWSIIDVVLIAIKNLRDKEGLKLA